MCISKQGEEMCPEVISKVSGKSVKEHTSINHHKIQIKCKQRTGPTQKRDSTNASPEECSPVEQKKLPYIHPGQKKHQRSVVQQICWSLSWRSLLEERGRREISRTRLRHTHSSQMSQDTKKTWNFISSIFKAWFMDLRNNHRHPSLDRRSYRQKSIGYEPVEENLKTKLWAFLSV